MCVCVALVLDSSNRCLSLAFGHSLVKALNTSSDTPLIIIIIINLIYIAQFDTNGILTALYIVITYIQMQYVHV